jgi:hypothetical protein
MEFGKTLRTAREAKGLTTGQIAERTHMMVQVVEGLENEDFSKIVAPIYGRGFVKLYCETVGLEPKPLVDAFMEIYSGGRGKSAAPHEPAKPEQRPVEPTAPEPPPKPVAPEPPQRVQETIDFGAPPAAEVTRQQPTTSRYAAPMPIDDGFSMPAVNWRMVALGAAAVAIVVLALLGVRALYRVTMTAPEEETTEVAAPAPDPAPAPTDAQPPAKAPVDRKPLPLKPFYIDSNHQTETENK